MLCDISFPESPSLLDLVKYRYLFCTIQNRMSIPISDRKLWSTLNGHNSSFTNPLIVKFGEQLDTGNFDFLQLDSGQLEQYMIFNKSFPKLSQTARF